MLHVAPIDSFFHEMNLFDTDKSIQSNNMIATYSQFLGPAGHFWSTGRGVFWNFDTHFDI